MDAIVYIKSFNNLLLQFLSEMIITFPNEKDLLVYEAKLKLLSQSNPRMLVQQFMVVISPHKTQILNSDESYFLNLENLNLDKDAIKKGLNFKKLYQQSDSKTKSTIIMYFQKLLKLGTLCGY